MKRHRRAGNLEHLTDAAGRHAFRSRFDQQTEDRKAGFLGKRGKRGNRSFYFHISGIIEIR